MASNSMHPVRIRPATKNDMEAVEEMIRELAEFEKMPDAPKLTIQDLQRDAFEVNPPLFRCIVAENVSEQSESTHKILGYAIYFNTYSAWQGKALMLEDLYVRMKNRKEGIGGKLFDAVAKEAVQTGCSILDFHVLEWNKEARKFYEKKGAKNLTQLENWCLYRLSGNELKDMF